MDDKKKHIHHLKGKKGLPPYAWAQIYHLVGGGHGQLRIGHCIGKMSEKVSIQRLHLPRRTG